MMYRDFLDAGYKIFGLHRLIEGGACGCGDPKCPAAGKHPVASNWQHTPHWSDEQIETMEQMGQLDTGYGVLVDGLLVVDIDERNGGHKSMSRLAEQVPEIAGAGMVVRTGSGGESRHLYFSVPGNVAMVQHLPDFPGIDFKSSGFVVGPGSLHKSGGTYEALFGSPDEIETAPEELVELLRKPERHRSTVAGEAMDVSDDEIADMLAHVNPDTDHETWYRCGMAIHEATGGSGFDIWDSWSARGDKYPGQDVLERRWHSFGKSANPVTLGTLMHYAEEGGWSAPVTFTPDVVFDHVQDDDEPELDTDGIDLTRPPGFVGKLTEWINGRCLFPRENLAVGAALMCVSNVAGMRYYDELDNSTPNLFVFGVSGSATGKEAVLKAHNELLRAAGVAPAVHGGIKSEQEIYRNLIRHQAAMYVVDELGEQFAKIHRASKGKAGSPAYLEGAIGALMSIYSKANSHALVTGDVKDEIREKLLKERKQLEKMDAENEASESDLSRLHNVKHALETLDLGIESPYLTIFGLTTPEKFGSMMDFDMAANGFMGRSLIFQELEDNPRRKPRRKGGTNDVPLDVAATLQGLYAPGFSETPARVERVGAKVSIETRPTAVQMLDKVGEAFWNLAEEHKELTGLTAIPRRGYEMVAKVSTVLAIPEGVRTVEHVRWAYALVRRDVEEKMKLAHSNSAEEKGDQLTAKIMSLVTREHAETAGRIRNKCRGFKRYDVDQALEWLVENGHVVAEESKHPRNGKVTTKYRAT